MKSLFVLNTVSAVAGFVIPEQNLLGSVVEDGFEPPWAIPGPETQGNFASMVSYADELSNNLELTSSWSLHRSYLAEEASACDLGAHIESCGHWNDHHYSNNKTVYQIITSNKDTSLFAKSVSQFDDIVKILDSPDKHHTVLVPGNRAMEAAMKFHPGKEFTRQIVEYHILQKPKTAKQIFHSRTIPTLLEQNELGDHDQRISTQFTALGMTINYMARIYKSNLVGLAEHLDYMNHSNLIDHILLPPFQSSDTLSLVPSVFSTLDFGLAKTGLYKMINDTSSHTGGTFFAPTNIAFRKLGAKVNAFLFTQWGEKYLRALLEYHIVFGRTLYSDAYHKVEKKGSGGKTIHIDLPTLLKDHSLSVDISGFDRFEKMRVNGFISVASPDIITKDGVVHIVNDVLIPPKHPHHHSLPFTPGDGLAEISEITVEDIIERLDPWVRKQ
ncbi:hypothetical protein LOZ53_004527 [Ophidiomyces ophidiicola]|nr:hypothetical protein LOZ55_001678 [Ophidiomyces ophidiicola]KAI1984193.1 hypothetical protein LOZ54_004628 [Ophidiomyces ophidiicola]KAI1986878.1 hypothetical protein LOZ53_004527 [Ophidiomyces ophidiicola]KAI1994559.1 hypothetical protein LOZ51_003754 [Ophidiomyces ophidiicola]